MYGPVLGAVTERDLGSLLAFVLGAVVGLAFFSQLLHRALASHREVVVATLIGLMMGSVRILWPWPDGLEGTTLGRPSGDVVPSILAAGSAFAVVVVLGWWSHRITLSGEATRHAT